MNKTKSQRILSDLSLKNIQTIVQRTCLPSGCTAAPPKQKENGSEHKNLMTIADPSQKDDSFNDALIKLSFLDFNLHSISATPSPDRLTANIFTLGIHQKKVNFFQNVEWEKGENPKLPVWGTSFTVCFSILKNSAERSYLLTGCPWLQPNIRHKYRWSRPTWRPFPGSLATSLFHSGVWTCWRNKCSLSLSAFVLSASPWRVKDAVPATAAAQEEKKPMNPPTCWQTERQKKPPNRTNPSWPGRLAAPCSARQNQAHRMFWFASSKSWIFKILPLKPPIALFPCQSDCL